MSRNCWTMQTGERIPITKMEEFHLVNTIAMLQRNHERAIGVMKDCMAMEVMNGQRSATSAQEAVGIMESVDSLHPLYTALVAELAKRVTARTRGLPLVRQLEHHE